MVQHSREIRIHQFGRTELRVSEFGLGCARIGGIFKREPREFADLLAAAYDAGITFYDTSDLYSQGESERLIGRAFRGRRDRVVIASKAGFELPSQRKLIARVKPIVRPLIRLLGLSRQRLPGVVSGSLSQDFSPAHLHKAIAGSLRRLQTDYLDLYQLHSPPTAIVEAGEWVEALETLKRQGKIRYYGISCDTPEAAFASLAHPGVSSLQLSISLLVRDAVPVSSAARERGVGVIARECLANGLLVKDGGDLDVRARVQSDEEAAEKSALIAGYRRVAAKQGATLTQLALQYVRRLEGVSVTLLGVSSLEQLERLLRTGLPSETSPTLDGIPQ